MSARFLPRGVSLEGSHQGQERKQTACKKTGAAWKGSELINKPLALGRCKRHLGYLHFCLLKGGRHLPTLSLSLIHSGHDISKTAAISRLESVFSFSPGFITHVY